MTDILLASPDDVVARLGRQLTESEALRVPAILADLSQDVIEHCGQDFQVHTNQTQILYLTDGEITLQRPVIAGPAQGGLIAIGGAPGLPDIPVPWFSFDGLDRVKIGSGMGIINLPEMWAVGYAYAGTARVTYSWGYPAGVPGVVKSVIANACIGIVTAPTQAAGLIGETIGPMSWRGEKTGGGMAVSLAAADLKRLDKFRNTVRTIQMRL